jgi:metal-dependent amidase/aminoacylase/carboxypeptidase family protein
MAKPGKTILFRCELDALPIHEINTFEHRSLTNGVSHKCGHDGHMAILWLSNRATSAKDRESYSIIPTEDGSGAQKVFSDTKFAAFNPDYVLPYIIYLDIKKSDYSKNDTLLVL